MTDRVADTKIEVKIPPALFINKGEGKWRGTTFMVKTNDRKIGNYEISFNWETTVDGALPTELHLFSKTGTRISSDLIRTIPLKQLLDRDVEYQVKIREQAPETIKFVKDNFGNKKSNDLVVTGNPKLKRSSKRQKTSASQLKEIELQMVALAWHDNNIKHATRPSAKHISQVTKISRTLIRTRISECRKLGLIPPSSHGNATVNGKTKKGRKR